LRTLILALLLGALSTQARAAATVPANGIDEPPRRGTYAETSLGIFTAMGGSVPLSNAQPYLGMTFGRELGEQATVFASLAIAGVSASCYESDARGSLCTPQSDGLPPAPDSFGTIFIEAGASYGFQVALRTLLSLKGVGGFTDLSPGPVRSNGSVVSHLPGFHFGAGFALDYDTHLEHFAVGIDAIIRYTLARYTSAAGNSQTFGLPSLAVMPRIRYVF
jgi:hypothetical protein